MNESIYVSIVPIHVRHGEQFTPTVDVGSATSIQQPQAR